MLITVTFSGCIGSEGPKEQTDKSKFIGTWEYKMEMGTSTTITRFTFYENDTACYNITYCFENSNTTAELWYSYTLQDDKLCCEALYYGYIDMGCMKYGLFEDNTHLAFYESDETKIHTTYEKISL